MLSLWDALEIATSEVANEADIKEALMQCRMLENHYSALREVWIPKLEQALQELEDGGSNKED